MRGIIHEPPENFTKVPGYEEKFAVSKAGEVWSCQTGKILKGSRGADGYIILRDGSRVHRLVALTYIPNPRNLPTVDHIDRNKQNNSVENLRWANYVDQAENRSEEHKIKSSDSLEFGKKNFYDNKTKKINKIDLATGEILETYESINKAAKANGLSHSAIQSCVNGRTKSCNGYFWNVDGEEIKLPERGSTRDRTGRINMIDPKTKSVIKTFETAYQAALSLNKKGWPIVLCARGVQKTAYGYEWKFVDE